MTDAGGAYDQVWREQIVMKNCPVQGADCTKARHCKDLQHRSGQSGAARCCARFDRGSGWQAMLTAIVGEACDYTGRNHSWCRVTGIPEIDLHTVSVNTQAGAGKEIYLLVCYQLSGGGRLFRIFSMALSSMLSRFSN